MDKPSTSSSLNVTSKNNNTTKTKVYVLSPDVLKKLGISSQISQLTKKSLTATDNFKQSTSNTNNIEDKTLDNEIKQQLSETLNNAIKFKINKNLEQISDESFTNTSMLQLKIDKETFNQNASVSTEVNFCKQYEESNEKCKIKQLNINESNLLENTNKYVEAKLENSVKETIKDFIKSKIESKMMKLPKENVLESLSNENIVNKNEIALIPNSTSFIVKPKIINKLELNEVYDTSIRKSGRKRKISSILENYVTELNEDNISEGTNHESTDFTEKELKNSGNKRKLSINNLILDQRVNSGNTFFKTKEVPVKTDVKSKEELIDYCKMNLIETNDEKYIKESETNDVEPKKEENSNLSDINNDLNEIIDDYNKDCKSKYANKKLIEDKKKIQTRQIQEIASESIRINKKLNSDLKSIKISDMIEINSTEENYLTNKEQECMKDEIKTTNTINIANNDVQEKNNDSKNFESNFNNKSITNKIFDSVIINDKLLPVALHINEEELNVDKPNKETINDVTTTCLDNQNLLAPETVTNKPIINVIENKVFDVPVILPFVNSKALNLNEEIIADIPIILVEDLPKLTTLSPAKPQHPKEVNLVRSKIKDDTIKNTNENIVNNIVSKNVFENREPDNRKIIKNELESAKFINQRIIKKDMIEKNANVNTNELKFGSYAKAFSEDDTRLSFEDEVELLNSFEIVPTKKNNQILSTVKCDNECTPNSENSNAQTDTTKTKLEMTIIKTSVIRQVNNTEVTEKEITEKLITDNSLNIEQNLSNNCEINSCNNLEPILNPTTIELDSKIADLLRPLKRGRPKGSKKRVSVPFFCSKKPINENKEEHVVENKEADKTSKINEELLSKKVEEISESIFVADDHIENEEIYNTPRRRSKRPRKEKKISDAVYYDIPSQVTNISLLEDKGHFQKTLTNEKTGKRRGRPRKVPANIEDEIINTQQIDGKESNEVNTPRMIASPSPTNSFNNKDNTTEDIPKKSEHNIEINRIESDDKQILSLQSDNDEDELCLSKLHKKNIIKLSDVEFEPDNETSKENESVTIMENTLKKGRKGKRNKNDNKSKESNMVECGVCNELLPNNLWRFHCAKHNYLCWRVGEEPIDLSNRKLCEGILLKVAFTKKTKFTCATCGTKRKSAVGYFSHIDTCQKTKEELSAMRVMCPICKKLMQPCSIKIHMRNHENETNLKIESIVDENTDDVVPDGVRKKRNAAKKYLSLPLQYGHILAQGLINQVTIDESENQNYDKEIKNSYKKGSDPRKIFSVRKYNNLFQAKFKKNGSMTCTIKNCNFMAFNLKEIKNHIEICPELNENDFICFACFFVTQDETEISKHILDNHLTKDQEVDQEFTDENNFGGNIADDNDNEIDENDMLNEEMDFKTKKRKQTIRYSSNGKSNADKIKFLSNELRVYASKHCAYPAAGKWSIEFAQRNYCLKNLFNIFSIFSSNWISVLTSDQEKYLPKMKKSLSVKTMFTSNKLPDLQGQDHIWKEFELFETELNEDTITIFCGGPIWELAWLPTPLNLIVDQILAVSTQRDFNDTFKTSQSYTSDGIIQFWNFGKLHFKNFLTSTPKLEFCLAHNHGNIWCMEWCPSGCYDDAANDSNSLRRMGLLALACSDGNLLIYSICFPEDLPQTNDNNKIYKPKESGRLIMQDDVEMKLGNWNYQCTKLHWSKIKGHSIITAGYSNGMVCLWDLCNASPLLKSIDKNGIITFKPYFSFQPHTALITALHFYPFDDGKRWLFTGSWDRSSYVWDLKEPSAPVFVFAKRGNVSDGAMINHWLCSFIAFDDVHFIEHTTTLVQNIRDFGYKNCSILAANSMVMGLSASDWANAIAQATLAGELCCTFPRQILVSYDVDKASRSNRFLLSYCEAIDKHLEPEKRKEKLELKNKLSAANIPEKYDKNFLRYLVSKENELYDEEPTTYEETVEKYGVIFCDINLKDADQIPPETVKMVRSSMHMKDAPTELYPILSQNRVRWNPNKQAYIYICSGYHSGFVRLRCVRFVHSKVLSMIT